MPSFPLIRELHFYYVSAGKKREDDMNMNMATFIFERDQVVPTESGARSV